MRAHPHSFDSPHQPMQAPGNSAQGHATADAHREANTLFRLTGDHDFLADDQFYTTTFTTLNGSGVTGEAIVGYDFRREDDHGRDRGHGT